VADLRAEKIAVVFNESECSHTVANAIEFFQQAVMTLEKKS
jgi:hypothetical protein